ncbi:MAG: ABC transporter substrate-binding protein [Rhodoblastus sp.]|nr:ABC transporter substrate-binding protein [Rhodoblastus sp.]MCB1523375.1 ABC transporter substrate-binding protein [Rhodoblastus sp.]
MKTSIAALALAATLAFAAPALAQKKYGPQGANDTEIKIGQTMPYSGPVSIYGIMGRVHSAYFQMVNEKGGINGRKINLISLDDAYSPPKTVEQTRKLVESDGVLFMFGSSGTAGQSAVQKYLKSKKVPQLMLSTGASKFNDPQNFPWTTPILQVYSTEGEVYAQYLMEEKPNAKVAILMQNDDFGRDYIKGFKAKLGAKAATMIVKEASFEAIDPTVDSQILALKASGADVLIDASLGKTTAQVMKKLTEIGWKPLHIVVSNSVGQPVLRAAGLDNAKGIMTASGTKRSGDPANANDPGVVAYKAFMQKYLPGEDPLNEIGFSAYSWAVTLEKVLKECGDDLTPENVVAKATSMKSIAAPALLDGVTYSTKPTDYSAIKKLMIQTFDGARWHIVRAVEVH